MKIGDAVAKAASVVVQNPCGGCHKSQQLMNSGRVMDGLSLIPGNVLSIFRGDLEGETGKPFFADFGDGACMTAGSVPPGLTFASGKLAGTPTLPGRYRVTVTRGGQSQSKAVRIIEGFDG